MNRSYLTRGGVLGVCLLVGLVAWWAPPARRAGDPIPVPVTPAEFSGVPGAGRAEPAVSWSRASRATTPPPADAILEPAPDPAVVRQELIQFDPAVFARLRQVGPEGALVEFPVPGSDPVLLRLHAADMNEDTQGAWVGTVEGRPGSEVTLGYSGEAIAGVVMMPEGGLYRVRYAGNGWHRVAELDPERLPDECGGPGAELPLPPLIQAARAAGRPPGTPARPAPVRPLVPPVGGDEPLELLGTGSTAPPVAGDAPPPVLADAVTTVDVLVVYSGAAAAANGGTVGIQALINAACTRGNTAHTASGTGMQFRVVHTAQVTYTESGQLSTDLPRLTQTSDGHMDSVHTLRNTHNADLVCLVVTSATDAAGLAYLWSTTGTTAQRAAYGFSVVVDAYADANLTFAHELGHNLGCGHATGDGGSGAYSYSKGLRFSASGTQYRTVMAYAPGTRITQYSNPTVAYLGTLTGASGSADNAQTLRNTKADVAAYRVGSTTYQDWTVICSADLNADTKPDLIWRNTVSGRVVVWLMDGVSQSSTAVLWAASSPGDSAWVPVTAGDFNADGKDDLIWRNSGTGRVIVWYMDGVTRTSTATVWSGDANWVPMAAGDFNADNKPDLLWRHAVSGRVIAWILNGITSSSTSVLWSTDPYWIPIACGDYNADGQTDIIWRQSTTGRVVAWYMSGVSRTSTGVVWASDATWRPHAGGDFNADGKPDLIWRNASTGRTIAWLLDGITRSSTPFIWGP